MIAQTLDQRLAARDAELQREIDRLLDRRVQAQAQLESALAQLARNDHESHRLAVSSARAAVDAAVSALDRLDLERRQLAAKRKDAERAEHVKRLEQSIVQLAELGEKHRARVAEMGATLVVALLAVHAELKQMQDAEARIHRDAQSMAAFLDPLLSATEMRSLGIRESGVDRHALARVVADRLRRSGVDQTELRLLLRALEL